MKKHVHISNKTILKAIAVAWIGLDIIKFVNLFELINQFD